MQNFERKARGPKDDLLRESLSKKIQLTEKGIVPHISYFLNGSCPIFFIIGDEPGNHLIITFDPLRLLINPEIPPI
jgi:hypothetical protein